MKKVIYGAGAEEYPLTSDGCRALYWNLRKEEGFSHDRAFQWVSREIAGALSDEPYQSAGWYRAVKGKGSTFEWNGRTYRHNGIKWELVS